MKTIQGADKADYFAVGAVCLLMIIRCILCGRGMMWVDEIFSFNLIHDPSAGHMITALGDQADGAPPVYYLIAKAWAAVFSDSVISLRMLSTCGFCVGLVLLWSTMRKTFAFIPTAFAIAVTIGPNKVIAFESLNIRFYGLLFALVSLAVFLGVRLCRSERPRRRLLAANALTQATLVLSHPLGVIYGAVIMLGVGLSDFLSAPSRIRPAVFASYGVGWLSILIWFRQFLRQADINQPHSWVPVPAFRDLFKMLHQQSTIYLFVPLLLLILIVNARTCAPLPTAPSAPQVKKTSGRRVQLLIALCLVSVTPLFWFFSRVIPSNSIFLPRYMIVTTIGWTILIAHLISLLLEQIPLRSTMFLKGVVVLFIAFAFEPLYGPPLASIVGKPTPDRWAFLTGIADREFGHCGLPIVCPRVHDFLPRRYYSPDATRYYYLLNWEAAAAPENSSDAVSSYKLLSAIKRHYPAESATIVDASEFLRNNPVFLVHDYPECNWCSFYLKPGSYKITRLEPSHPLHYDHEGECPLLLVERQP